MSQALLIILGVYLAACYAFGTVMLVRLWTTKTIVRPTSKLEPTELIRAAQRELDQQEERRAAA